MAPPRQPRLHFGAASIGSAHHFALVRTATDADLYERFAWEETPGTIPRPKVALDADRWRRVAEPAAEDFRARVPQAQLRAAAWREGETLLAPHFGKELALLFWAAEDADPAAIPAILANWAGLAPEERWWLYTTINATSRHAGFARDRGWRKAIKIALAENPVTPAPAPPAQADLDAQVRSIARRARPKPRPPEQRTLGLE